MMDIMEKIKEKVNEESKDIEEYMDMAEAAEHKGMHKEAMVFKDIAHDEMSHMKYLSEITNKVQ